MAKYTLLFKDFEDAGGELPASFALLEGLFPTSFIAVFNARNAYKEIGAETIAEFENRLDAKALEIYPRIKALVDAQTAGVKGRNRKETTIQELTQTLDGTFDKGQITRISRNLAHAPITEPLNNTDVVDGMSQDETSGQDLNHSESTNAGTITREYEENNVDTSLAWADFVDRFKGIFEECLKAFDVCFLGVW